jgi:crotonobetaine/carnitine-CoA ligase
MIPFCLRAIQDQPVPPDHAYRWWAPALSMVPLEAHFGVSTMGWWGMTETVTHGILTGLLDASPFRSIGRCAPEYEIVILHPDGTACVPGETGELLIRGVPGLSLFHSYLNNPEATAAAFDADGYMITGDRVTIGEGGHLWFADRAKDILKVGGENVAASEIEAVISAVPGVVEAAVVGKPDAMLDEVPAVFVIAAPGFDHETLREAIFAACNSALADFKRVREVHCVPDFPRVTLEKVAKAELKRLLLEMEVERR